MSKIQYTDDLPDDGRVTFAPLLKSIRDDGVTGGWAALKTYDKHLSANDAANRLRRSHDDFTFAARLGTVYARYEGETT